MKQALGQMKLSGARLEKIREVKKKTNNNNLGANKLLNTKLALQLNPRIKM